MEKREAIITTAVIILITIAMIIMGVNEEKHASPCPKYEIVLSTEDAKIDFMQIEKKVKPNYKINGIWQFAVSQNGMRVAIVPYFKQEVAVFNQYGQYLYNICFKSNNESFSLYYDGNNLRILLGGDAQIIVEFDDEGGVVFAKKLNREYSSIHSDWVTFYTYNKKIQAGEYIFEKTTDSFAYKILGISSMVTRSNGDEYGIVLNMTNHERIVFLFIKISQLVLSVILISGFLSVIMYMGRNHFRRIKK